MEPYPDNPPIPPMDPAAAKNVKEMVESGRRKREQEAPLRRAAIIQIGPELADVDAAVECYCDCHPKPANPDKHDGGVSCGCQLSEKERKKKFQELLTVIWEEASADSGTAEDGYRMKVYSAAEKEGATIRDYLPAAPFVIAGVVEGHSFYLRERHDVWRLVVAGDDDPTADVWNSRPPGALVIAEGTTSGWDWQNTQMVTDAIKEVKTYLAARNCSHQGAHTYCPDCGKHM